MSRWVLVEFGVVILNIHIVAYAKEFLTIFVATCEQDGSDAHNIVNWELAVIRSIALQKTKINDEILNSIESEEPKKAKKKNTQNRLSRSSILKVSE